MPKSLLSIPTFLVSIIAFLIMNSVARVDRISPLGELPLGELPKVNTNVHIFDKDSLYNALLKFEWD